MSHNPILWKPAQKQIEKSQLESFRKQVNMRFNIDIKNYTDLHKWSVNNIEDFWKSIWGYLNPLCSKEPSTIINDKNKMFQPKWFEGCKMNFAENLLRFKSNKTALISIDEKNEEVKISYNQLFDQVKSLASSMKKWGVSTGDRVCGIMPNSSEAVVAMLATTSIGAIWSSCSPDFGVRGILNRFKQINPKIIFACDNYFYSGKKFSLVDKLSKVINRLNTLEKVIITNEKKILPLNIDTISWKSALDENPCNLEFQQLPFDHPIYIMYSSGTTGTPKSIMHGAGGTLLQHLKELRLHSDISTEDNVFYYTTCGWMMWNWLITSLAIGSTIILFDGSPFYPNNDTLWSLIDKYKITHFGISPKYLDSSKNFKISPKLSHNLDALKVIFSTGSPLRGENFDYVYQEVKDNIRLSSISGGTDIISCFALGNPQLPVYRDEIQCIGLGMDVQSLNSKNKSVKNMEGELICAKPFPSMPISFWKDKDDKKYFESYFNKFPNVWYHGDFISIYDHGGVQIFGRSDTTLNPGGVRIGTSEIYDAIDTIDDIIDSIVVGQKWKQDERIILFVKLKDSKKINDEMKKNITNKIKKNCSPKHLPKKIVQIKDIPYTLSGKKVELAVKKIINGNKVDNKDALINPESLKFFENLNEIAN
tara:strand:- start:30050 stop:31996 length:1947 start_codon:yes stop_codon:yes gene_type:complete